MGDGRWEMGDGRWEMGDGRWEMGDGREGEKERRREGEKERRRGERGEGRGEMERWRDGRGGDERGEKDHTILICRYFGTAACMAKLLTRKGLELVATALRFVNWGCPGGFETSKIRPNRWLKEERKTITTSDGCTKERKRRWNEGREPP